MRRLEKEKRRKEKRGELFMNLRAGPQTPTRGGDLFPGKKKISTSGSRTRHPVKNREGRTSGVLGLHSLGVAQEKPHAAALFWKNQKG